MADPAGMLRGAGTSSSARRPGPTRYRRGRLRLTVGTLMSALLILGATGACGNAETETPWAGTNLDVNDVKIRYASLPEPEDADLYRAGADVPLYLWLTNAGKTSQAVTSVASPLARTVTFTGGALPVALPPGQLVQLGPPNGRHFVLQGITRQLLTEELIPVTVTFVNGTRVTFDVEANDVDAKLLTSTPTG